MRSTRKALAPLALLALAACGGTSGGGEPGRGGAAVEDEQSAIRFAISDLQAASRDGDGDEICNQIFTPTLADSVTSASRRGSCAQEVEATLADRRARYVVDEVKVLDPPTKATAIVEESNGTTSKVSLVKQGGEWRISSIVPAR